MNDTNGKVWGRMIKARKYEDAQHRQKSMEMKIKTEHYKD